MIKPHSQRKTGPRLDQDSSSTYSVSERSLITPLGVPSLTTATVVKSLLLFPILRSRWRRWDPRKGLFISSISISPWIWESTNVIEINKNKVWGIHLADVNSNLSVSLMCKNKTKQQHWQKTFTWVKNLPFTSSKRIYCLPKILFYSL